jgi:hypothetical protein
MAARQADQHRFVRQAMQRTEYLGFFAAHHIGQPGTLDHAWHDVNIYTTKAPNDL